MQVKKGGKIPRVGRSCVQIGIDQKDQMQRS